MTTRKKKIALLGVTGSIKQNACAVVSSCSDRFETTLVAVERFCRGEIKFGDIYKIISSVKETWHNEAQISLEQLGNADEEARCKARKVI